MPLPPMRFVFLSPDVLPSSKHLESKGKSAFTRFIWAIRQRQESLLELVGQQEHPQHPGVGSPFELHREDGYLFSFTNHTAGETSVEMDELLEAWVSSLTFSQSQLLHVKTKELDHQTTRVPSDHNRMITWCLGAF